MPPFLLAAAGLIGAAAVVKLIVRESRRVSSRVDAHRPGAAPQEDTDLRGVRLERDPVSGAYRPSRDG